MFTRIIKIIGLAGITTALYGQPYYDAAFIRVTSSPDAGIINRNAAPLTYTNYIAGFTYPITFKKDSSRILLGAYTEYWAIRSKEIENIPAAIQTLLVPVTYIKRFSPTWSLATSIIPRWNGNANKMFSNSFQAGGSVLASYRRSANITYRFGLYYNSEFFGPFFIPLAGIDWKISSKDNLFGVLPQILTYEHRVSNKFSWGASYRMFNNSYRTGYYANTTQQTFLRINEMQLLLEADFYLTKTLAFNIEAGHSMFRKIRFGKDADKKNYYAAENVNDGFLFKAAFVYRIRLR